MTEFTRRDALLLTTAAAAVSSAVPSATAQTQQQSENSLLEVPNGTVNGSLIPITVRIPQGKLKAGIALKQITVELNLQNPPDNKISATIFKATLTDKALPPLNANSDIILMARLRIANEWWKPRSSPGSSSPPANAPSQAVPPFKANLVAGIAIDYADATKFAYTATQTLTVQPEECPPSKVSLLRLAITPAIITRGKALLVKAVAPPVPVEEGKPPRLLKGIECQLQKPAAAPPAGATPAGGQPPPAAQPQTPPPLPPPPFTLTTDGSYLADEAFVSFNVYPTEDAILAMQWKYDPPLLVTAQAYVSTKA